MASKKTIQSYKQYAGIGLTMFGGMIVLTFGGYLLDSKCGTGCCTFIGFMLGIMFCGYQIYRLILKTNKL